MNPSLQLVFDEIRSAFVEIHRKFDESDARMERLFSWTQAALEQRGAAGKLRISGLEQFGATQHVVADNWGRFFDGDGDSIATGTGAPVVADNWGGLFDEVPAFFPEPFAPAPDAAFDSEFSCTNGEVASTDQPVRMLDFHLGPVEYALPAKPVDPTWTSPHLRETVTTLHVLDTGEPEYIPASDKELEVEEVDEKVPPSTSNEVLKADVVQFNADQILRPPTSESLRPASELLVPPSSSELLTERPHESALVHDSLAQRARNFNIVLGGGEFVFVGVDIQRLHNDFAPDDPGLLRCVRLGPVECALRATPLGGYDGSLDDDPSFAYPDAPLARAVGRAGQALAAAAALRADAVGAAEGGQRAWVAAAGSALTLAVAASNDAVVAPTTYSTDCPTRLTTPFIPSTRRSTATEASSKDYKRFEHRYITTSINPVQSMGVFLPCLSIDANEVLMVFERSCDVNVVSLWLLFSPDWVEQQPWPPPSQVQVQLLRLTTMAPPPELRLTTCDAGPVPWPLFNMIERCSVMCQSSRIWKPPWHVPLQQGTIKLQPSQIADVFGLKIPEASAWRLEPAWLVCTLTPESRQQKWAGAFTEHICFLRAPCNGHEFLQFPWDPGGFILLHRLGGKPNLKERGMLGISYGYGWAVAWAWALSPVQTLREWKATKAREQDLRRHRVILSETEYPLSSYCSSSPTILSSSVPRFLLLFPIPYAC